MRPIAVPGQDLPHTIFVFPDNDASGVLDAFGHHVLATLPASLIASSAVTALGAVHKPFPDVEPGHKQYPKTVAHYWTGYQPGAGRPAYRPRTLAETLLTSQALASSGVPLHQCVDSVASAITHLANLQAGTTQMRSSNRQHVQVEKRLANAAEERAVYRGLLARFVIDREPLTEALWTQLCPVLRRLGAALAGGDANAPIANDFMAWPVAGHAAPPAGPNQTPSTAVNSYRYVHGNGSVDIRLGSIHMAKGQTHLATLVLETYNQTHFLHGLMPWLVGQHQHGAKCASDKAMQRLLQVYVAMTRPTHLLCLALRQSSLGAGKELAANQEKLMARGWQIQHLSAMADAQGSVLPTG